MSAAAAIERWFRAALTAVDPEATMARAVERDGRTLRVDGHSVAVRGHLWLVAVGKAAVPMARAAERVCGDLIAGGVAITKVGHATGEIPERVETFEAAHPIPDERGEAATRQVLELVGGAGRDDVVLALISGGGSALLESPVPPVVLADLAATTDLLLKAGAPIQDLNAVRTPLSRVKGGGLRAAAADARFVTLILSDVLGNDPRVIASGPTVPGCRDRRTARAILDRYGLWDKVPPPVRAALESDEAAVPAGDDADVLSIVGDSEAALQAMRRAVEADGLEAVIAWRQRGGEARDLARAWVAVCRGAKAGGAPVILGGGEATVTVRGGGVGGRNTEFALAAALELERLGERGWAIASLATDGDDGPTGVAGAIADGETAARARRAGIDPVRCLDDNDSLAVFRAAGGLVRTGPTGTNVNDLYVGVRLDASARRER